MAIYKLSGRSPKLSFRRLPDGYLPNYTGVVQPTR
jgi:hypothetical protein